MSVLDKVIAAVRPRETQAEREAARAAALNAASTGDWLSAVLAHHLKIEEAFASTMRATTADGRLQALNRLGIVLTGHANAEESVLYPALVRANARAHADTGYAEQAEVKVQLAELGHLPPLSQDFLDKLEHIREAVVHHMYEEEGTWFLQIRATLSSTEQDELDERYLQEFDRYVGLDLETSDDAEAYRPYFPNALLQKETPT